MYIYMYRMKTYPTSDLKGKGTSSTQKRVKGDMDSLGTGVVNQQHLVHAINSRIKSIDEESGCM